MNEKEQTNTMRYIDKLICDVEKVLMGLGYKVFTELNGSTKVWCVELLNANSSEGMPIRHISMIRGLVKGYLHSFDYFCGTQKIYIYDECKGLKPDDDRYSTLENAMSRVSDDQEYDLFVNYGTHTERYVIDNNDKQTVNIAISEPKKIKNGKDMTQEFVTQRVAELLRLKKFDEWCWWFYCLVDDETPNFHYSLERWTECPHLNSQHPDDSMSILSAPTVQAARDWLEEKYGFFIEIGRSIDLNGTYHYNYMVLDNTCKCVYSPPEDFTSSYDAANEALEYVFENLI